MVLSRGQYMERRNIFTKFSCSIDESHMVHYQPMLKKYRYHSISMCLLVKHKCKRLRRKYFSGINYVITGNDYAEWLKA